jgi:hypothetical protein
VRNLGLGKNLKCGKNLGRRGRLGRRRNRSVAGVRRLKSAL